MPPREVAQLARRTIGFADASVLELGAGSNVADLVYGGYLAFGPSSRRAAIRLGSNLALVWDVAAGKALRRVARGLPVAGAALSPDGATFVQGQIVINRAAKALSGREPVSCALAAATVEQEWTRFRRQQRRTPGLQICKA